MTAEEYSKICTNDDVHSMYDILMSEGVFPEDYSEQDKNDLCKKALGWIRELDDNHIVHSRIEDWYYKQAFSKNLSQTLTAHLSLDAIKLRMMNYPALSIHEWNDEDAFVIVLAKHSGDYDKAVAVISFNNVTGDHFELFDWQERNLMDSESLMELCKDISGFRSYGMHNLGAFSAMSGYTLNIDKDGKFLGVGEQVSIPGDLLFKADANGMVLLESVYGY